MSRAFLLRNPDNEFCAVTESYRYYKTQTEKMFQAYYSEEGVDKDLFRNIYFETHSELALVPHIVFNISASLEYSFSFQESPVVSGGVDTEIFNLNRNSLNTSLLSSNASTVNKVSTNVVVTTPGNNLLSAFNSGFEDKVTPQLFDETSEWILKPSTAYLFQIETKEDNTNLNIILKWFEG